MEKEGHQPDSLTTVTIKPEYAPSESFSTSEPPPAYHRPRSTAVQVARIISFTVIAVSIVLGCFILASAYVTSNASCKQLEQELQFLAETADRSQPLQPEALIQEEQQANQDLAALDEKIKELKEIEEMHDNKLHKGKDSTSEETDEDDEKTVHFKMPLELDFDDLAGALMEKNQRSRMNCIVEKKRAEQLVDHQPKTIQLPFGLNLTTDPRFEHVSGERMAIFCESGNDQKRPEPEEDDQEETIMIQPIMIPIPHTNFQTHMPMQAQPQVMPNGIPNRMPMQQHSVPQPHPLETMRPPMPISMIQIQPQQSPQQEQSEPDFPPVEMLHRIAQQIIAQKIQADHARSQEENQSNDISQQDDDQQQDNRQFTHQFIMQQRIPIPEEILSQINRLPNNDAVVAMTDSDGDDQQQQEEQHEMQQPLQQQQHQESGESSEDMNVHIGYGREMPQNIPIRMVQVQPESQPTSSEEMRPHYLHPRSVRSVDNVLPKSVKRVKRCSCDCAC